MLALARDELIDNRYRVVRRIGQGAWATVYEGIDEEQERHVAIKILNDHLVDNPQLRARFIGEAEAATAIDSPFVVGVYAVGALKDGRPYIVMELLDGEDLGQRIAREGPLHEERAVELATNALSGLAHAHARGVLHRDIKPDNLVIVKSEEGEEVLKIVDLGISKLHAGSHESLALTRTNVILGSPVYMSPEQARGTKHMDHRSDVYSMGVVLYEALTGKVPHEGENFNDLMFKIALEDVPDPRTHKPDLNPELAAIIMKALERDLEKRTQSASAFREALLEWGAKRGARMPATPSSAIRVRAPTSSRRLLVVDDEDEGRASAIPRSVPGSMSTPPKSFSRPDIAETLLEGAVLSDEPIEPSRFEGLRRRVGVFLVLALFVGTIASLLVLQPWTGVMDAKVPPPPPSTVAAPPPPPDEVLPAALPVAPAPTLTASSKPVVKAAVKPVKIVKAVKKGAPTVAGEGEEGEEEAEETEEVETVDPKAQGGKDDE